MVAEHADIRTPPTLDAELLEAIREALAYPGVRRRFLLLCIDRFGWVGGYRRANARLSQWLDVTDPHHFPAVALDLLMEAAGNGRFLDSLFARAAKAELAQRIGPMRTARPREREKEIA